MDFDAVSGLFNGFNREIWLITARAGDARGGLIATFVSRASLVPTLPRVTIGLAKHHHTWGLIESSQAFAMHLVGEEHLDWVWRFGLRSAHEFDKLCELATHSGATGSPILVGAPVWLDCRVETSMDTGDRTIYLAEVVDARVELLRSPLTFNRLQVLAPADKLRELDAAVARDIDLDRDAILAWRHQRAIGDKS